MKRLFLKYTALKSPSSIWRSVVFVALVIGMMVMGHGALADPSFACNGITDGLVACYPFDGNANDASGNGNNGSIIGDVVYVQGKNDQDQAVYFNNPFGSARVTQYMSLPYSKSIQNMESSSFTISILYKTTDNFQYNGRLFGNHPSLTIDYNAGIKAQAYSHVYDGSNHYYVAYQADNNPNAITTDGQFHWQFLVLDRENNSLSQYIDEHLINVTDISGIGLINLNGLVLGASKVSDTYSARLTAVDELRLYNRALSESEIKQLYNPNCGDACENETAGCKHATYSVKGKTLTIPFIELPVIDGLNNQPTGEVEMWQGALKLKHKTTDRFRLLNKQFTPRTDGSSSTCPATYSFDTGILSIPYVDVPTIVAVGQAKFESEGKIEVFKTTMKWEEKMFVVQEIEKQP